MKTALSIIILLSFLLISCSNNRAKEEADRIRIQDSIDAIQVMKGSSIEKECKIAYENKKTLYDLIRIDKVKERIIKEYSQKFYDKVVHYVQVVSPITYEQGKYYGEGWEAHLFGNIAKLSYSPTNDELTISLSIDGRIVQSDGEIHYNTEGWSIDTHDVKNEFGEVVETECVAGYTIDGIEYSYSKYKFALVLRWNYLTLWTNEFGSLSDVESIQIKDHDSGKIYNIRYDERHHHQNGGAMNDDIGVFIVKENMGDFIRLVSGLTNFSILIKSNYDDSVLISKPENFNNIADAYQQIIVNTQKLRENVNK